MSETAPASAQNSDLPARFTAAIVMVAVAVAAIYFGGWPFRLLAAAAAAVMIAEWAGMYGLGKAWRWIGGIALAVVLLGAAQWLYPVGEIDEVGGIEAIAADSFTPMWRGFGAVAALALLFGVATRRLSMAWGMLYIGIPAFALMVLEWARFDLVFWLMLVTWATDIFAYFAGRAIGGPKLAPRISPNKTWAGLVGGMAGAAVVGAVAAWLLDLDPVFIVAGALMGLIAQLGDLYESRVKRRLGVKDSGTILPGHGGVLDRLDGLLPVILVTLALLLVILGAP
jgi:phosphatidate cytidylyltransferase